MQRIALFFLTILSINAVKSQVNSSLFDCIKWRMIGPHRGGRTVGACGIPNQPNTFYIGVNNGGVWKTTDFGHTWKPIFDNESTGSIGDLTVAPSNPEVIYVASGEGLQRPDLSVGNGIYRSDDAGKTWQNTGLSDGLQIGGLAIDPQNSQRVFAAVLGHPYGPNAERGVFRTENGGKTWKNVLFIDENTGAIQVVIDPSNPKIVYADLFSNRLAPWENGVFSGKTSGLFKSTDGGETWLPLKNGLPTAENDGLGRIGFCIAPSQPSRLYATVDAKNKGGIYRSDNGGETWVLLNNDLRLWDRGSDFAEIKCDPKNSDIVYSANVVTWKSIDGGKYFTAFKGAPGGDDYHRIWINPLNTDIILIASDQGAVITVNGGQTFSSWYNQPTAQFYHVSCDNDYPYRVLGGQQESGSCAIASRGNDGQITFREWHPSGGDEYGYLAADPLNPNIVYGGRIKRFDRITGQNQDISPEAVRSGTVRYLRTAPVLFSPINPHKLFFACNVLFVTENGGKSWKTISPDLSRETFDIPDCVGVFKKEEMKTMARRGVIYSIAPSPIDSNLIWAGTDDGLIHITHDFGEHWEKCNTPNEIVSAWSKISIIEASHFDKQTAYAAVNRIRLDDYKPHIIRTKDGGKTWQEITTNLPNDPINSIKEDPQTKGLLFAGSERAVYVSFDDGEHWQSLRLNMPATSIRDLVIKDDDLVVATHGRSFWILDNITPLRQLAQVFNEKVILFKPQLATRVRWNTNTDTPLPPDEPAGQNPPDGAMIDYYLNEKVNSEVVLEISNSEGNVIRRYSNLDKEIATPKVNIPDYWIRPQTILSNEKGAHRFLWDLKYEPLSTTPSYPIAAIYENTESDQTAPFVLPETFTIRLIVNEKTYEQPLLVRMDPRVKTTSADLKIQHDLALKCYENRIALQKIKPEIDSLRSKIKSLETQLSSKKSMKIVQEVQNFNKKLDALDNGNLERFDSAFSTIFGILEDSDATPTEQAKRAANETFSAFDKWNLDWKNLKENDLIQLNKALKN